VPAVVAPVVVEPAFGAGGVLPAEVKANHRRALSLAVAASMVPALLVGVVVALVVTPLIGLAALVVAWFGAGFLFRHRAPQVALRRIGAVPLDEHDNQRIYNVTEGLCATFGLRMPSLHVVFDAVPNACALGRDPGAADLVVTSGLLELMGPIELEGVLAHELAHVKRGDNGISSIAISLARFGGGGLLKRCIGEGREYRADVVGAAAVRFPRGLLDALRLMEQAPPPAGNSVFGPARFGGTRWVWIDPSVGLHAGPAATGDLNATSVRIAALSLW